MLNIAKEDIRSVTSSNLRHILDHTKVYVIPGSTTKQSLNDFEAYKMPAGQEWRIPLLSSLIKLREGQWEISFDEEDTDESIDKSIDNLIKIVCTE